MIPVLMKHYWDKEHKKSLLLPMPKIREILLSSFMIRAEKLSKYIEERRCRMNVECAWCEEKQGKKEFEGSYYDTPWHETSYEKYFCSEECREHYESPGDFNYFWCTECNRMICEQNPQNGWHVQYKMYREEQICLQCYQDLILEEGIDVEAFEMGQVPGMFFNYGNPELKEAGFEEEDTYFIRGSEDANKLCKKAIRMIDEGKKVIVCWESLAEGGSEGTVTLMYK